MNYGNAEIRSGYKHIHPRVALLALGRQDAEAYGDSKIQNTLITR